MSDVDIDAILRGNGSRRRWLLWSAAAAVVVAAAVAAFLLTRSGETDVVTEPQRDEAVMGRLSTEVELSGSALAERSATLGFAVAGVVGSIAVAKGDEVRTGAALAILDDADARRRVETAEVQLRLAQLRLENLMTGPQESVVASASQAIASAQSQVIGAEQALALLLDPPSAADLASAEQAVATALGQLSSAEQASALLSEPPSAADLASAEQAVAAALGQLSGAEQALALLSEPPGDADLASAVQAVATTLGQLSGAEQALALLFESPSSGDLSSAEQAVANALGQLSIAEQALGELLAGPSEAEISEARSDVAQAQAALASARTMADELIENLTEVFDSFCERYGGLGASDAAIDGTCTATLPLSDAEIDVLRDSFEDRSSTYESDATALVDANVAYVESDADRDSAGSTLALATDKLADLLQPVPEEELYQAEQAVVAAGASHDAAEARLGELRAAPGEDEVFQAEQAVEAAKASHAAAVARLEELRAAPGEDEVYQAEQAVEAAKASRAAAVARLEELRAAPGEDEVFQAEQALEAARASHAAAVAALEDLRAAADERDVEQARASLEGLRAGLASAQAHYDELVAGPTENAIEQQRNDVRLAELSVEEARAALGDLTVFAPFDGVVEAVNVQPGDRVASAFAAFVLSTSNRMLIALTVTEEELPGLEAGQTGLASFDAIDGIEYPVRVESVSRVPNSEQGVVTYDVEARILNGAELAGAASQGSGTGFRPREGFRGGSAGSLLAGLELPEGVTIQQLVQAMVSGGPLPEGVVLPEGLEEVLQSRRPPVAAGPGTAVQRATAGEPVPSGARPLPAPGMSANVTIVTEVREESVLVPVSAVRQLDGGWFVSVPAPAGDGLEGGPQRVFVEVGESDGENIEIPGGIEAGTVLLIGADNAGIAFTATQQQRQANPGFGPGPGGFGPVGGGGRQ